MFDVFLIKTSYFLSAAIFAVMVAAAIYNGKHLLPVFANIKGKVWILFCIFSAALLIRMYAIPHTHYVFYDEYEHLAIARHMSEEKQFSRCDFYTGNSCMASQLPSWPPGYHLLLSFIPGHTVIGDQAAYRFNAIVGALSVLALFFAAFLMTEKVSVALLASTLLAFCPLHLKFSGNTSLEMTSLLFILLSVTAVLLFTRLKSRRSYLFAVAVCAFTLLIRPENGLLLLVLVPEITFDRKKMPISALLLFIPYLLYLPHIRAYTLTYWLANRSHINTLGLLVRNTLYWLSNDSIPLVLSLIALIGAARGIKKKTPHIRFLLSYFLLFLFFYTFIHKTTLYAGDAQRFNIILLFPVVILSAIGFKTVWYALMRLKRMHLLAVSILIAGSLINYGSCLPYLRAPIANENFSRFQNEYKNIKTGKTIDSSYLFVAYNPPFIISQLNRPCIHIKYLFDDAFCAKYLKNRRLIIVKDYWCDEDPQGYCSKLQKKFRFQAVGIMPNGQQEMFFVLENKK